MDLGGFLRNDEKVRFSSIFQSHSTFSVSVLIEMELVNLPEVYCVHY